jgi:hypothetical protein
VACVGNLSHSTTNTGRQADRRVDVTMPIYQPKSQFDCELRRTLSRWTADRDIPSRGKREHSRREAICQETADALVTNRRALPAESESCDAKRRSIWEDQIRTTRSN